MTRTRLRLVDALFDLQVARLVRLGPGLATEELVARVEALSGWTSAVASTRLTAPEIERLLLERGQREMRSLPLPAPCPGGRRRILHVATELYPVGGHTRIVANWVALDRGSDHVVALTRQIKPTPAWFIRHLTIHGAELFQLDTSASKLERALRLRQFAAERGFTHIVLHHSDDAIPLLAFAPDGGPPVLIYNHADQLFWNGSGVADAVIDYSPTCMEVSRRHRGVQRVFYLPLALGESAPFVDRAEAKRRLGLRADSLLLVSIGTKSKYRPWRYHDFFSTYGKLLSLAPHATLVVIGVAEADRAALGIRTTVPNLILAGEVVDPSMYAMAADIYVESLPVGAGLGACDMCRYGAAPLFAFGHGVSIDGTLSRGVFEGSALPPHMENAKAQIALALRLCADESERRAYGEAFAAYLNSRSVGANWLSYLERLYAATAGLEHRGAPALTPSPLPPSQRIVLHAQRYRLADLAYDSLRIQLQLLPGLRGRLREIVLKLARYRFARVLFRHGPGLFRVAGKS